MQKTKQKTNICCKKKKKKKKSNLNSKVKKKNYYKIIILYAIKCECKCNSVNSTENLLLLLTATIGKIN
jgi:hypothetical protein